VFVVGYLGDWRRAGEVLFESDSMCRNTASRGNKREDVTGSLASRTSAGGGLGSDFDCDGGLIPEIASTLTSVSSSPKAHGKKNGTDRETLIAAATSPCLRAGNQYNNSDATMEAEMLVTSPITARPYADNAANESKLIAFQSSQSGVRVSDVHPTLDSNNGSRRHNGVITSTGNVSHCLNAGGMGRQDYETETMVVGSFRTAGDGNAYDSGDVSAPLTTATDPSANIITIGSDVIPIDMRQASRGEKITNNRATGSGGAPGVGVGAAGDPAFTVSERGQAIAFSGRSRGDDGRGYDRPPNVTWDVSGAVDTVKPGNVAGPAIGVRRLTPLECERLQGLPDNYTLVPHGKNGKLAADGPRYKAIGNSMAVPVMAWIGRRLAAADGASRGL